MSVGLNNIEADEVEQISSLLINNCALTSINFGTTITKTLAGNSIGAEGAMYLASALKSNTSLRSLNLSNCVHTRRGK